MSSIVPSPQKKVTVASSPAGWLSIVGQALTFALVAAGNGVSGVVTAAAQSIYGVKTFAAAIVASAGIQVSALWNTNGTSSGDVGVKNGVSTPDGSVNSIAHIWSARTGIGGTEVEKFWVTKNGVGMPINSRIELNGDNGGVYVTYRSADGMAGLTNGAAAWLGMFPGTGNSGCSGRFTANGGVATGVGNTLVVGTTINDKTGTPGAATIDEGKGRAALASGATSVVITSNLVDANSVVLIEWEDDPGQRHRVTYAAGAFTVTLTAAAASNLKFRFVVVK